MNEEKRKLNQKITTEKTFYTKKMIDILPDIFINITDSPREFLEAISNIAKQSGKYFIEENYNFGGMDIIVFCPKDQLTHENLYGQLIYTDDLKQKIRVEIRAVRWKPEDPTRDVYIEAAHHIFDNLIKAYNLRNRKRYRLRIVIDKRSSLPPKAKEAFEAFIILANKRCLHPLDWERLYRFVRICHATRAKPSQEELWGLLCKEGFEDNYAKYISDIADHLLKFMRSK